MHEASTEWRYHWLAALLFSILPWALLSGSGVSCFAYNDGKLMQLWWLEQGQPRQQSIPRQHGRFTQRSQPHPAQLVWQSGHVELALFANKKAQLAQDFEQLRQGRLRWAGSLDSWHLVTLVAALLALWRWQVLWRLGYQQKSVKDHTAPPSST